MNQLQDRIEELGSAIINIKGNKVYIMGFYNSERLNDWLNGSDCWQSKGIYDKHEIDFSRAMDNSLIIIMQYDVETIRYQFKPFFKGVIKYTNLQETTISRIFTLRKCLYTKQYNIIYFNEINQKKSIVYNNIQALEEGLKELFPNGKFLDANNKTIKEGFNYIRKMELLL